MIFDYEILKLIWWVLIGLLLIGFAIMDGQDIGVCTLLPLVGKTDEERRVMINTIGAHWEGNQVWFIVAGGVLFAAFPLIYAAAFSGFYWAMMAALWTLFLRPVSFKYRSLLPNARWRKMWDWGLIVGSVVPALIFGVAIGNLFMGVPFYLDEYLTPVHSGGFFGLLTPLPILFGLVSVFMLIMQGATYLAHRTVGDIQARTVRFGIWAIAAFVVLFLLVGVSIPSLQGFAIASAIDPSAVLNPTDKQVIRVTGGWLHNYKQATALWAFPVLAVLAAIISAFLLYKRRTLLAFCASSAAIFGTIMTAGVALFPFLLPSVSMPDHSLTVYDSVSSHRTLVVMLFVVVFLLPLVTLYTAWAYRVMRGKVTKAYIQENQKTLY